MSHPENDKVVAESVAEGGAVDALVEEFLCRQRRGERPMIAEYVERYPHLAEQIRGVFPALLAVENLKRRPEDVSEGSAKPSGVDRQPRPQRLGDYRLLQEVGRGGMGVVYEAEQESLGRRVALKVLAAAGLNDTVHLQRFEREARAAARLHHTNIVPVFGVGDQDGYHYYVMQFIQGLGLDEVLEELRRLRQGTKNPALPAPPADAALTSQNLSADLVAQSLLTGPPARSGAPAVSEREQLPHRDDATTTTVKLPGDSELSSVSEVNLRYWKSVARIGVQVAQALEYAHEQGTLHRDIKPSNLLLDAHGNVWVTDFGLAKASDHEDLTHTGDIVGTVRYMAPERFQGHCDARSDICALGLTLYEMLALHPAYTETDRHALIRQVSEAAPARLGRINRSIPRDLQTIVHKAIDRDPNRRYRTAAQLAEDLQRFIDDEPILARRSSSVERLWRWSQRQPVVAGLGAALVLVFLIGFAAVAWKWRDAERQNQIAVAAQGEEARQRRIADRALIETKAARQRQADLREIAEARLYFARIALALQAWEAHDVPRALELLEQCRPFAAEADRRGWEWHYLERMCHAEVMVLAGHTSPDGRREYMAADDKSGARHTVPARGIVCDVAYSPDGRLLASAGGGNLFYTNPGAKVVPGEVIVRDARTGEILHTLSGHQHLVTAVAFSPDSQRLASCSYDHTIKLWDAQTGKELATLVADAVIGEAMFAPDGRTLVSISQHRKTRIWDLETHKVVAGPDVQGKLIALPARMAAFRPSQLPLYPDERGKGVWGELLAIAGDKSVRFWSTEKCAFVGQLDTQDSGVSCLAFSGNGTVLGTIDGEQTVRLWNTATGKQQSILPAHGAGVYCIALSRDGHMVATAGREPVVRVWDARTGRPRAIYRGHAGMMRALAFHPDGKHLASASYDGTVRVWDLTGDPRGRLVKSVTDFYGDLAFEQNGDTLVAAGVYGTMTRVDAEKGVALATHRISSLESRMWPRRDYAFSAGGRWLAAPDASERGVVNVWRTDDGSLVRKLSGKSAAVTATTFSRDSRWLVTAQSMPAPPNGKRTRTVGAEINIWDAASGEKLKNWQVKDASGQPAQSNILCLAVSPDGKLIAAADHASARVWIWDRAEGRQVLVLENLPNCWGLAFSPDSGRLATTIPLAGAMILWDVTTGREIFRRSAPVYDVVFSPDGRRLAATGYAGDVYLWDAETGQDIIVLRSLSGPGGTQGQVPRVIFSPDGRRIASINLDKTINVWDAGAAPALTLPPAAPSPAPKAPTSL